MPAKSATLVMSSPVVTTYSTPSVLTAATSTAPPVLLYSTPARLHGTSATSISPFISCGAISSAAPYMVTS